MTNRRLVITPEALAHCARRGMKQSEVAQLYGVNQATISRLVAKRENKLAWEAGKAEMQSDLRGAQLDAAIIHHDRTMLIWCGKQYLGQSDQTSKHVEIDQRVSVRYIAEWGRDNDEIESSGQQLIEAGDDDWDEED